MKNTLLFNLLCMFATVCAQGQTLDSLCTNSRLPIENTAIVLPGVSIGVQGGTSAFTSTESNLYRVRGILTLSGLAEIDVANIGEIRNMVYSIRPQTSWGLKLKLMPEQDQFPAMALTVRSSVSWQQEWHDYGVLQDSRSDLYRQGLAIVRYEYGFSRAQLVLSKTVFSETILNAGIGIEDVQLRGVEYWGNGPNYMFPIILNEQGIKHNLSVQGFLSVAQAISPKLSLIGEAESIPFLNPNASLSSLNVDRAYCGSAGLRYYLAGQVALDGTYFALTDFSGNTSSELRIGLFVYFTAH